MGEAILVDIQIAALSMRIDTQVPLHVPVEDIMRRILGWASQQFACPLSAEERFLCNVRTGEILMGSQCLYRSRILPGDHLILF